MTTGTHDAALQLDPAIDLRQRGRNLRPWWRFVATLLVLAIFAQAVFAGLMLSGFDWARPAHLAMAIALIASTFAAGLVAVVSLRQIPHGLKLGLTLLALAVLVVVQTAIGKSTAGGANLLWLHIPLGVALVGLAGQAVSGARRLGE